MCVSNTNDRRELRAFDLLETGMPETAMSSPRFPVSSRQRNDQNSGFGLSCVAPTLCSIASSISISVISLSTQIGLS